MNRDDLADGGAYIFAQCIEQIHRQVPGCKVEVLTPDFAGSRLALEKVVSAKPEVFNHNIETCRRVFHSVRPRGNYEMSLELLGTVKALDPDMATKSGIIVGMGEEWNEVVETMEDLRNAHCDLLTIGQYLRPSSKHLPVSRFYTPAEFEQLGEIGRAMGFKHVASGPLVRSSYHADEQQAAASSKPVAIT